MNPALKENILSELSDFITAYTGISFPKERWKDMERGIHAAAMELGFNNLHTCTDRLLDSSLTRQQLEILVSHLTVGETYFFREPKSYEFIEKKILNDLILKRRGKDQYLRIWSAGCATGEEPYSLAMILNRLIPDINNWNISILATDINPRFLQKAAGGIYNEWSFRGVPQWIKDRYFIGIENKRYKMRQHIRQLVNFSYLNLAEDSYPALTNGTNAMDLILCRNVLMYFSMSHVKHVIENMHRCLVNDGWLAVSSVETSHDLFSAFKSVNSNGVTFYTKAEIQFINNNLATEVPKNENPSLDNPANAFTYSESLQNNEDHGPDENKSDIEVDNTCNSSTNIDEFQMTNILYQQGLYSEAEIKLEKMLQRSVQNIQVMQLMARVLANQGRFQEAIHYCERAIGNEKLNASNYYLLATIQQESGLFEDAINALKRAIYLEPDFVLANFTLANLVRTQGKPEEAARHFTNTRLLLDKYQSEEILPESEGLTAKRLREILDAVNFQQEAA